MGAAVIFGAVNLSSSIAGYLGLIDNVNSNVKKLLHQSFVSAVQNLNYATTASGTNQMEYIRRARDLFIDAISVEENENLISSYVGLGMCQHLLGDFQNSSMTIEEGLNTVPGVNCSQYCDNEKILVFEFFMMKAT